ncbi:Epidermal growth factor-binding protein type B [Coemansia sp. S610]|nr:Epidermal growth factor-binding protein type B [Coemansia sp. S610]
MKFAFTGTSFIALAILASASTQQPLVVTPIAGGKTGVNSFSFAASITSLDPDYAGKKCSGILISDTTVLTTANCLTTNGQTLFNPHQISVALGGTTFKAKNTVIASKFTPFRYSHNIGIISLESSVPQSIATPVKLYPGPLNADTPVFAVVPSQVTKVGQLPHFTRLKMLDRSECSAYGHYDSTTQLCVEGNKDICSGDEGAALVVSTPAGSYAVIGMASYSAAVSKESESKLPACGNANSKSYFEMTRVWAQWIAQNAQLDYAAITVNTNAPQTDTNSPQADHEPTHLSPHSTTTKRDASSSDKALTTFECWLLASVLVFNMLFGHFSIE